MKTYSHLAHRKRVPSEYEIVTTKLFWHVEKGFEVNVPVAKWYEQYQRACPLACANWDDFVDPRETTYTKYTAIQKQKESHVDALLQSMESTEYADSIAAEWLSTMERMVTPLRYVFHGLQMVAAYVGQMAPSGRITIAAAFQAADELRRIHRIAYRMGQLRMRQPSFGEGSRSVWENDPCFQPLRRTLEQILVTYDWGEAFVALNVSLKPALDDLLMRELPALARSHGDYLLGEVFASFYEDCQWQRDWTCALVRLLASEGKPNADVLRTWTERWEPKTKDSLRALAPFVTMQPDQSLARVDARRKEMLDMLDTRLS